MSWANLWIREWQSLRHHSVALLTIFGGTLFYSFLYPLPYHNEVPLEQTITVVNMDKSAASYELERWIDATPQVKITERAGSIEESKQQFLDKQVSGILVIPEHFYRDLLLGKSPTLSLAGDGAYFLVYGTIAEGVSLAAGTMAAKVKIARLIIEGESRVSAASHYSSLSLNVKPTFNGEMGYLNYVVPSIFLFILHQTLLIGIGILGAGGSRVTSFPKLLVRYLNFMGIYLFLFMYYFGFSFEQLGIHRQAEWWQMLMVAALFISSTSLLGMVIGEMIPHRELVTASVLIISMPLIFSAGFIWPVESLPAPVVWLSNLMPSSPGIQAFMKLNQQGAPLSGIYPEIELLIWQALGWGVILFGLTLRKKAPRDCTPA
ncbi:ABC transporter permease [Vibrio ulleungensis]|uniref:ABC transporter permease n=1 Tax=Vibrio ulleungensis TaxID=2807619 RepID=A0ABS2HJ02_9VIBR|nr:ABC transporter permease [Vibrio ulleungensis]MBM7036994.1 ABC transporter permease [Vibrio ulleungensis]